MENPRGNYCDLCKKIVQGGRTLQHSTKREHLKLLIAKFRRSLQEEGNFSRAIE